MKLSSQHFRWFFLCIFSIAALLFTVRYFSIAFPIIHIDLSMDRTQALESAKKLANENQWGPASYSQAIKFSTDTITKTFVELEGGGTETLINMIEQHDYEPYVWEVRHFKEAEQHETICYFTPHGIPYGFEQELSDNTPGAALATTQAQIIAETEARTKWHVDFDVYRLIEHSTEIAPSNRIDHTFVYEKPTSNIGDGRYRLTLIVSGDTLTTLKYWIKIPHDFMLRYQEMRSHNATIAFTATMLMILFYIIIGCLVGLVILVRSRSMIWKAALIFGTVLAFLQSLTYINELPLAWSTYDTAMPMNSFFWHYIIAVLQQFFTQTALITTILIVAEGLTRRAFGNQIQFWSVWNSNVAHSWNILQQTINSYLVVAIDLAFGVGFYIFVTRYLGWWTPAEELVNPNILATYVPWFSPFVNALLAGVLEEALFRAIPLAGAALLAKKYGHKKPIMITAFIVQALIFGAAHANYAQQPAYARLVELFVPSCIFGGLYLMYGLLPAMIAHVIFDIIYMSLPLFISTASGNWINQIIIILLACIPLLMIIRARIKKGTWTELDQKYLNNGWVPTPKNETYPLHSVSTVPTTLIFPKKRMYIVYIVGIIGLCTWFSTTRFEYDATTMQLTRSLAIKKAKEFLTQENITLDTQWEALATLNQNQKNNPAHQFVWQQVGRKQYNTLLEKYLTPTFWMVRFVQPYENAVNRAYEHTVYLGTDGSLIAFVHEEPESSVGAHITEEEARTRAHAALKKYFNMDGNKLLEIKAQSTQLPNRRDWQFIFEDKHAWQQAEGKAVTTIEIHGDRIAQIQRGIDTAETWDRTERDRTATMASVRTLCMLFFYLLLFVGINLCAFNSGKIARHTIAYITTLFALLYACFIFNQWPILLTAFDMSKPWISQIYALAGGLLLGLIVWTLINSSLFLLSLSWRTSQNISRSYKTVIGSIALGAAYAGIWSLVYWMLPTRAPLTPDYISFATHYSFLHHTLEKTMNWTWITLIMIAAYALIYILSTRYLKYPHIAYVGIIVFTTLYVGMCNPPTLLHWILLSALGNVIGIIGYTCLINYDHAVIPLIVATPIILNLVQELSAHAYSGVSADICFTIITIMILAYCWFLYINRVDTTAT